MTSRLTVESRTRKLGMYVRTGARRSTFPCSTSRIIAVAKASGLPDVDNYFAPLIKQTSAEISEIQKELEAGVPTEQGKALFTPIEWIIFAVATIGCAVGIHGLITGYITI